MSEIMESALKKQLEASVNAIGGALMVANGVLPADSQATNICDAVLALVDGFGSGGGNGMQWQEKTIVFDVDTLVTTGTDIARGLHFDELVGCDTITMTSDASPRTPTVGARAVSGFFVINGENTTLIIGNSTNTAWTNNISSVKYDISTGTLYGFTNYTFLAGVEYKLRYLKQGSGGGDGSVISGVVHVEEEQNNLTIGINAPFENIVVIKNDIWTYDTRSFNGFVITKNATYVFTTSTTGASPTINPSSLIINVIPNTSASYNYTSSTGKVYPGDYVWFAW